MTQKVCTDGNKHCPGKMEAICPKEESGVDLQNLQELATQSTYKAIIKFNIAVVL